MKKIKFRGFNKKNNKWLHGFYLQNRGAHFVCPDEFADGKSWEDYEVVPETVGQFTGLLDKNGKEIYEGDIIRHSPKSDIYYIVEWHACELIAKQIGASSYAGIAYWLDSTEIIGNIHKNPELLEK